MGRTRWLGIVVMCVLTLQPAHAAATFDRAAWIADFEALRHALTHNYANLEWAVQRGMDLPATERHARAKLEAATNDYDARAVFERFIRAFGDGHLELAWPRTGKRAQGGDGAPSHVCAHLGFRSSSDNHAVGARLPGYRPLDPEHPVAAGTVTLGGKTAAVLRVEEFGPSARECGAALTELGLATGGVCDDACGELVRRRADMLFVRGVEHRLRALSRLKPDFLLVDLAANGGGNDSAIAVARMVGGNVPTPAVARLRGEGLAADILAMRAILQKASVRAPASLVRTLSKIDGELAQAQTEAAVPCDRSGLWRGEPVSCSGTVRGPFYAGGLSARPLDPQLPPEAMEVLSSPGRYTYTPGLWTGPVAVLVDGDTASSAELFTAMLQDAKRAVIVGSPTYGASCGWMLEPEPAVLPHSRAELWMPDCSRFRADGTNEVDGITPDVMVGFRRHDTAKQRVERLVAAWPDLMASIASVNRREEALLLQHELRGRHCFNLHHRSGASENYPRLVEHCEQQEHRAAPLPANNSIDNNLTKMH